MAEGDLLADLLKPIPGSQPGGEPLRYTNVYDQIKEARRCEDDMLPQGVWAQPVKRADWALVETLCRESLIEKSKDLQIVAWLAQAWIAQRGLEGLSEGLDLLKGISDAFWDTAYPLWDPSDTDLRMTPYEWANQHFAEAVLGVPITQTQVRELKNYSYSQWISVQQLKIASRTQQDPEGFLEAETERLHLKLEEVIASVHSTPPAFYEDFVQKVDAISLQLRALEDFLLMRLPMEGAIFRDLKQALGKMRHAAEQMGVVAGKAQEENPRGNGVHVASASDDGEEGAAEGDFSFLSNEEEDAKDQASSPATLISGPIQSRQAAYACLAAVEAYLSETESHSPTPHALRQIVSWEKKTFSEIFQGVSQDPQVLQAVLAFLCMDSAGEN